MNLQNRIHILSDLGKHLSQNDPNWLQAVEKASAKNQWFTKAFIQLSTENIVLEFLDADKLQAFAKHYHLDDLITPKKVGIVMAGNIPLVGFHDFLCVFLSGHQQAVKLSSKDDVLMTYIFQYLTSLHPELESMLEISERIGGCDAYIATGNNTSAAAFETYFEKWPHIIRKNRTSIAILYGDETPEELHALSADVHTYFGLGCRNVTKIFVPEGYDFVPLIEAFNTFGYFRDHHGYSNNYDYQLSLLLLNNIPYMSSQATLLVENKSPFSAISMLHYETYKLGENPLDSITDKNAIQAVLGKNGLPFGKAQKPDMMTYADGTDTMQFLLGL